MGFRADIFCEIPYEACRVANGDRTGSSTVRRKRISERTTKLSAMHTFLTRVDAVSEAEVVVMVESLNSPINSASGALSDTWDQAIVPGTLVENPDSKRLFRNNGVGRFRTCCVNGSLGLATRTVRGGRTRSVRVTVTLVTRSRPSHPNLAKSTFNSDGFL